MCVAVGSTSEYVKCNALFVIRGKNARTIWPMNSKFKTNMDETASSMPSDFSTLTAETVLDAVYDAGYEADGRMLPLNSYENRVYRLGVEGGAHIVVKFYRPERWSDAQIQEEHDFMLALDAAEIPVIAPVVGPIGGSLLQFSGFRYAVFPSAGGRAPDVDFGDTLQTLGRALGRMHAVGAQEKFSLRPELNGESFGRQSLQFLAQENWVPADLQPAYFSVAQAMLDEVDRCFDRVGEYARLRLHGDCHLGNILLNTQGAFFLDFDDSRTGPAIQDLWMFLSGERSDMQKQMLALLEGYEAFYEFNPAEMDLIEALRSLRLLHYSAWLAKRWSDPAFKLAFSWFDTPKYWQDRILEMREQIALMNEPLIRI